MDDTFTASDFAGPDSASSDPAPASTPVASSAPVETTAPPEAATIAPAVDATVAPSTDLKTGPIPFDVHKTALDNARAKAVAEWDQQYGWAKQVTPQEFQQVAAMAKRASADPIGYLQDFVKELQNSPEHAAQLRSFAARELARRQTAQVETEPIADLPIQLEDGRVVHLFSAEQQAKREAYLQKQWQASLDQKLQPLQQSHDQQQQALAAAQREQAVTHFVSTTYDDLKTWPGMDQEANQKAVASALAQVRIDSDDPREVTLALNAAYRHAVLPTLQRTERQAVLTTLHQQANGNTVNPAQPTKAVPKSWDDMSIAEALAYADAQQQRT